jgi:hypothetical protein
LDECTHQVELDATIRALGQFCTSSRADPESASVSEGMHITTAAPGQSYLCIGLVLPFTIMINRTSIQ